MLKHALPGRTKPINCIFNMNIKTQQMTVGQPAEHRSLGVAFKVLQRNLLVLSQHVFHDDL